MNITKISKSKETGISGYTIEEFKIRLEQFVQDGWGEHKLAIDDQCGHWYWLFPKFEVVTLGNDIFVEVEVSEYTEEIEIQFASKQASISEILKELNSFINEKTSKLDIFAYYDCSIGGGLSVPSERFCESNKFGVPQVDLYF